jgi:hypothetical protein
MTKKNWIADATKNAHGQFSGAAKRAGKTTRQYAAAVLAHPESYSAQRRKQAALAKTLMKLAK